MNASDSCHMSHLCVCMYMSHVYDTSNSKQLDAIVDQYLKFIKSLSVDTYTDPLLFWKINGNRFKELEPLAKKVLGVQASEAAVKECSASPDTSFHAKEGELESSYSQNLFC